MCPPHYFSSSFFLLPVATELGGLAFPSTGTSLRKNHKEAGEKRCA